MPPSAEGIASRLFLGPALRTQPDRRLVTLVREGYETAFEEIVRRYGRPLSRYAASIVGGRSEDVTQDAFSKALLALRRNDAEIDLRPWLFRIVRNTALNDLRDSPPSPELLAEAIAGGGNPAEELERREELADLMKRLQALPEPQRAAIVMRELEGLGHEEIAAALGLTGGGARQAIYRARRALRDGLGMLVPLPALQAMLAGGGSGIAETAGTAGVSVAGVGGVAGAGVALKATAATVLVAGAVGAGVALEDSSRSGGAEAAPARLSLSGAGQATASRAAQDMSSRQAEEDRNRRGSGEREPDGNRGGRGETEPGDEHGGEPELVEDRRGHGGRGEAKPGDDHGGWDRSSAHDGDLGDSGPGGDDRSGSSDASGHGGGSGLGSGNGGDSGHGESPGSGHGGSGSGDSSGSGSGGSGSSGSGEDGSGSSGGGPGPTEEPALDDDSGGSDPGFDGGSDPDSGSGSGSGTSGSGDSGTESSISPEASS
jgi:RNA polymerase sigma factor (sigma-70 family)